MWYIPDDQIVKIQNRMSDIRNTPAQDTLAFFAATYELLGTLDAILFDARNMERKKSTTMILPEDKKDSRGNRESKDNKKSTFKSKDKPSKMSYFIKNDEEEPTEKKMNSHERRKERRRLEREAAKVETEKKTEEKSEESKVVETTEESKETV